MTFEVAKLFYIFDLSVVLSNDHRQKCAHMFYDSFLPTKKRTEDSLVPSRHALFNSRRYEIMGHVTKSDVISLNSKCDCFLPSSIIKAYEDKKGSVALKIR